MPRGLPRKERRNFEGGGSARLLSPGVNAAAPLLIRTHRRVRHPPAIWSSSSLLIDFAPAAMPMRLKASKTTSAADRSAPSRMATVTPRSERSAFLRTRRVVQPARAECANQLFGKLRAFNIAEPSHQLDFASAGGKPLNEASLLFVGSVPRSQAFP